MFKIHSFDTFYKILESEEKGKSYDQTLDLIMSTILGSYSSLLAFPDPPYDQKIKSDLNIVKSSNLENKNKSFIEIINKVKKEALNNKIEGAQEAIDAWVSVSMKALDALDKIIEQYKTSENESSRIGKIINDSIDNYFTDLEEASDENKLKDNIKKNESLYFNQDNILNENIFKGKKSMIEDVSRQITIVLAKLSSFEGIDGMEEEVQNLRSEVNRIGAQMGNLLSKKNKDIDKNEIKDASARLSEIPTLLDNASEDLLKKDNANKEAASILIQAFGLVRKAKEAEIKYFDNKERIESDSSQTQDNKIPEIKEISFDSKSIGKFQPEVKSFQELVTDKFKNSKKISSLPFFKKMGIDGKFGPSTRAMIGILKSGFGLKDESENTITNELIGELKKQEPLKESKVFKFDEFSDIILESFDIEKALSRAKSFLPKRNKDFRLKGNEEKSQSPIKANDPEVPLNRQKNILSIANDILISSLRPGTNEEKIIDSVKKIRNKWEFKLVNDYIKLSYSPKTQSATWLTKELLMSLKTGNNKNINANLIKNSVQSLYRSVSLGNKEYKSFQKLINGEFDGNDIKYIEEIDSHLNKIGVNSTFSKNYIETSGGERIPHFRKNSFLIDEP